MNIATLSPDSSDFEALFVTAAGDFDEWTYLFHNPDVALQVRNGAFSSGQDHFHQFGEAEYRRGDRTALSTRELSYRLRNPDVREAIAAGVFKSGFEHWSLHGRDEEARGLRKPYRSAASTDVSEFDLSTWRDGYVILPGLISSERCDEMRAETCRLWEERASLSQAIDIDVFLNTPEEAKVRLADAPEAAYDHPFKINNLYFFNPIVRDVVMDEKLGRVLRYLLDGDPVALTSLNFRKGSEQGLHLDTFYMPPALPHRMVAAWVALEDVTEENGPLTYVPGSNRIPPYFFDGHRMTINHSEAEYREFGVYFSEKIEASQLRPTTFMAKKGDVLIWHSLLFHGGSPITKEGATRESLVAHYFAAADYPGGTCTGTTHLIEYGEGRYYEDRAPRVASSPAHATLSF